MVNRYQYYTILTKVLAIIMLFVCLDFVLGADEYIETTQRRKCRLFEGMHADIRRRYPSFLSDIRDGLNFQCVAAVVFIAFALRLHYIWRPHE